MPRALCPSCSAPLQSSAIPGVGAARCPTCGDTVVPLAGPPVAPEPPPAGPPQPLDALAWAGIEARRLAHAGIATGTRDVGGYTADELRKMLGASAADVGRLMGEIERLQDAREGVKPPGSPP